MISNKAQETIRRAIISGWSFNLEYSDLSCDKFPDGYYWSADFFRRAADGLFDNYKCGLHEFSANDAIEEAWQNVLNAIRVA